MVAMETIYAVCWLGFLFLELTEGQNNAINLAAGKPADQIGAYGGAKAYKAVDGQLDMDNASEDYYLNVCAKTDTTWYNNVPAHWWVDLGDVYIISDVTVYNTYHQNDYTYMSDFFVYVVGDNSANQSCGVYNMSDPVGRGLSHTFTCGQVQGRYVHIRKLDGSSFPQFITLCEVVVRGEEVTSSETTTAANRPEPETTVNSGNTTTSTSTTTTTTTEATTTSTTTSTTPGPTGCPPGYYGDRCQYDCGHCLMLDLPDFNPCDVTGRCIAGCEDWWTSDTCQTEIVRPYRASEKVTILQNTTDTIQLLLEQVNVPSDLSRFYGYKVSYGTGTLNLRHQPNTTTINVTLPRLTYNTQYVIDIQPYRVMEGLPFDYGQAYPTQLVKTPCAAPDPPAIISIIDNRLCQSTGLVEVKYQVPNESRCDSLVRLELHYRPANGGEWTIKNASLTETSIELDSFHYSDYVIKLVVANNENVTAENTTPEIKHLTKVSDSSLASIFASNTVLPWALFGTSAFLNICILTVLFNMCCGRRKKPPAKPTPVRTPTASQQTPAPSTTNTSPDPEDVDETYATHIINIKGNMARRLRREERRKARKEKKEKKKIAPHYRNPDGENDYAVVM